MKALVTGHKGFIGSHVYEHLVGLGFDVTGIDFPVDIGNFAEYSDLYDPKFDVVIHLAAFAALRDSIENPNKFWENNVEKSQPILITVGKIMSDYSMLVLLVLMGGGKTLML